MPHSHALEPTSPAQLPLLQLGETCRETGGLGAPSPRLPQLPPAPPPTKHDKGNLPYVQKGGKAVQPNGGEHGMGGLRAAIKGAPSTPHPGPGKGLTQRPEEGCRVSPLTG